MSQKINICLSDEVAKKLTNICQNTGLKKSAVFTLLINDYHRKSLSLKLNKGGEPK